MLVAIARKERELLSQFQRLPGLPSSLVRPQILDILYTHQNLKLCENEWSKVGLETVLDMDDTIEFEDIMNLEAGDGLGL